MDNLVAVYGTLRIGEGNHRVMAHGSEFVGYDILTEHTMYHLGGFPAIVPDGSSNNVLVEIHRVNEDTYHSIEILEGYPMLYDRKQIETIFGEATVYFMHNENGELDNDPIVQSGDWVEQYKNAG